MTERGRACKYTLLSKLGQGGMGIVFRARDEALGREVAIKFLPDAIASESKSAVERFRREAMACIDLAHPNVIKILDVGEVEGRHFYVMEILDGATDLDALSKRQGPLECGFILSVLDQVCDALHYCHRRGMIHRDIKPANIMQERSGRVILMDFGLVKMLQRTALTDASAVLGTPRFLAPEVLRGKDTSPRSDLWSLGVTAWELLAGRLLFGGESTREILRNVITGEIPSIATLRPDLPGDMVDLLHRFLERDPARRWPDAASARQAVRVASGLATVVEVDLPAARTPAAGLPAPAPSRRSGRFTRPTRPLPDSATLPPPASRRPRAPVIALCLLVAVVTTWAVGRRTPPAPPVAVVSDVRMTYISIDRLRVDFRTDHPVRAWLRGPGGSSAKASTATTIHRFELPVGVGSSAAEVAIGAEDRPAPLDTAVAPRSPLEHVRRLVGAVKRSGFTDAATRQAFLHLRPALVGAGLAGGARAIGPYLRANPPRARPADALLARLRATPGLLQSYEALRPILGTLLLSPALPVADRWTLMGALDRLDSADVFADFLGFAMPFGVRDAIAPAITLEVTSFQGQPPQAPAGRRLYPPHPRGVTYLFIQGEVPPRMKALAALAELGNQMQSDGELADVLRLQDPGGARLPGTGLGGVHGAEGAAAAISLHMRVGAFHPQVAFQVRPPGAPAPIGLRRLVGTYDRQNETAMVVLTLRGAMVPGPGQWRIAVTRAFDENNRPHVRVDEAVLEGPR